MRVKMDVFISYSSKDTQIIQEVCKALNSQGFSYWVAYENNDFGNKYAETIIEKIEDCKIFTVFVSSNSNLSTHVINEINSAVMRDKKIVPVLLDDVKLSPAMEYYLSSNHYIHRSENNDSFIKRLTQRIADILGVTDVALKEKDSVDSLSISAASGNIESLYKLGKLYYYGSESYAKDFKKAFECFIKSAEKGHAAAQNNVAWCYETGEGVKQNWEEAFRWYSLSAKANCAAAQYSLAWMYENGIYVAKNSGKAIYWHIKAAENGYAMSQYKLGLAYLEGEAIDKNPMIANHWLMLAADQGVVFAQYSLAKNYYFGIGCNKDVIKAKQMFLLASSKGYVKAEEALEKYYDIHYNSDDKTFIE